MTQARVTFRTFWRARRREVGPMDLSKALAFAWRLYKRRRVWRILSEIEDELDK